MHVRRTTVLRVTGLLMLATSLAWLGMSGVRAQPTADEASRTRELAERLLLQPYGAPFLTPGSPDGQAPTVQLLVGQLPASFPSDIPLPPGARLLGSLVRSGGSPGPSGASVEVVLDAPGAPRVLQQFYEESFAERGWSSPPSSPYGPPGMGGFQPQLQPVSYSAFCTPEEQSYLTLSVRALSETTADLRLSWYTPREEAAPSPFLRPSSFTPCSMPEPPGPPGRPFFPQSPIPALVPPAGTRLLPMEGGGGPGSWASEAVAESELAAADLESHFSQQLSEAGWVLAERGSGGPLTWSTWQVTQDDTEWYGLLLVTDLPAERRRALSVRVYSPSGDFGPFGIRG